MRCPRFIPIAVLVLAAACNDTATGPTSVGKPLFAVSAGTFNGTLNTSTTPSGGHLQTGSIFCLVNADLSIDCSTYELAGVGKTDANLSLSATYSATIDCSNHGKNKNNAVESQSGTFSDDDVETLSSGKNGRLRVPTASADPFSVALGCPNPNWTASIRPGTLQLVSFTYSLSFPGEAGPAVSIVQP